MFDLTQSLARQARAKHAGMVRQAAREINACTDPVKRWEAMRLLRAMQANSATPPDGKS